MLRRRGLLASELVPVPGPGMVAAFFSHDHGSGGITHKRVKMIADALMGANDDDYKIDVWLDEYKLKGGDDLNARMAEGIGGCDVFVVFITQAYLSKASGQAQKGMDDNCKFEFDEALQSKGVAKMLPVVLEARCRDPGTWPEGSVRGKLAGKLYVDLSFEPDKPQFEAGLARLHDSIVQFLDEAPKTILVVGECGDGKSTLINNLRDPLRSSEAATGRVADGVTKEITAYQGKAIDGHSITLLDTPGVGDGTVGPMDLMGMLESYFVSGECSVDTVIVTTKVTNNRLTMGARVVQILVDNGFVGGEEKWHNVVLVGTRNDKADEEDRESFVQSIMPSFFRSAGGRDIGTFALTGKDDVSQLVDVLKNTPNIVVGYAPPTEEKGDALCASLARLLSVDKQVLALELEEARVKHGNLAMLSKQDHPCDGTRNHGRYLLWLAQKGWPEPLRRRFVVRHETPLLHAQGGR